MCCGEEGEYTLWERWVSVHCGKGGCVCCGEESGCVSVCLLWRGGWRGEWVRVHTVGRKVYCGEENRCVLWEQGVCAVERRVCKEVACMLWGGGVCVLC